MAQLVSLVQPSESIADGQLGEALAEVIASDRHPEDGCARWEDDGGAVLPAVDLPA